MRFAVGQFAVWAFPPPSSVEIYRGLFLRESFFLRTSSFTKGSDPVSTGFINGCHGNTNAGAVFAFVEPLRGLDRGNMRPPPCFFFSAQRFVHGRPDHNQVPPPKLHTRASAGKTGRFLWQNSFPETATPDQSEVPRPFASNGYPIYATITWTAVAAIGNVCQANRACPSVDFSQVSWFKGNPQRFWLQYLTFLQVLVPARGG